MTALIVAVVAAAALVIFLRYSRYGRLRIRELPGAVFILLAGSDYRRRLRAVLDSRPDSSYPAPRALRGLSTIEEWEHRLSAGIGPLCSVCGQPLRDANGVLREGSLHLGKDPEAGDGTFWCPDCRFIPWRNHAC